VIPGVSFSVDGQPYVTDASGRVHAPLAVIGTHQLSVSAPADTDDARHSFGRWFDGATTPRRNLRIYDDRTVAVAFAGAFRVPISFQDSRGVPLDRRRISDVSLVGPAGETVRVAPSQHSIWLSVPAPSIGSRYQAARPVRYSLASASFEAVGVANRGDDAFTPGQGRPWAVKLRVYTLRVRVRKPLVGGRPGQVVVRSGAGVERSAATGADGVAVLSQIPRDLYSVSPRGTQVAPSARVQVTRDQLVDLTSYTAVEVAAGVLGLVLATLGACTLALLVRRRLRPLWSSARAHLGGRVHQIPRGDETK
jgi:hypothetical protein